MNDRRLQPALVGGLVTGVLSALPIVSAGNLCCCLWVVGGGVVAAYYLQQGRATPVAPGDGAFIGLLAGLAGAFVYLVVSIPITLLTAPMQRVIMERLIENGNLPPEFREYLGSYAGGFIGLAFGFVAMLVAGAVFSTLGGLVGAVYFGRQAPARAADAPPLP